MGDLAASGDQAKSDRVMAVMLDMQKLDIRKLKEAAEKQA